MWGVAENSFGATSVPIFRLCQHARCAVLPLDFSDIGAAVTMLLREAAALDRILAGCASTVLEPVVCAMPTGSSSAAGGASRDDALVRYDDNENGSITSAEARRHGIAPVRRSHLAYRYMRDGDGDGIVCE